MGEFRVLIFCIFFFTRASALIMRNLEGGSSRWTSFLMFYAKKTARLPLCSNDLRFCSGKTLYKNLRLALKPRSFFEKVEFLPSKIGFSSVVCL